MSIHVSVPNAVADAIYWYLLEVIESGRTSDEVLHWFHTVYRPKVVKHVWPSMRTPDEPTDHPPIP